MANSEWQMANERAVPPGYKQTEVGVIPEDWEVCSLSALVAGVIDNRGKTPPLATDGYPLLEVNAIYDSNSNPDFKKVTKYVDLHTYEYWFRCGHPSAGDILIVTVGTAGASAIIGDQNGCIAQNIVGLKVLPEYSPNFVFQFTRSRFFGSQVRAVLMGAVQPSLKVPHILRFLVCYPPTLAEQEAIAAALSDADALIEALEQLIAKKRQVKQGAMQELLTGKRRLPGFSGEWEVKRLEELAEIRSGGTPSTREPTYWDGDILWCTPTDITALKGFKYLSDTSRKISALGLKSSSAEMVPANSIVMTSRATIGECAINQVPVSTNQGFKNLTPFENVDVEFLYYLLVTKKQDFISLCGGSTFLEIGKTQLTSFEIQLPTTKAEQTAIAAILSDMDAEIAALEEKLVKARQVKQGMMQELLTGRIRLPV